MRKKKEIVTKEYFDVLEKIKKQIINAQYQVLTVANVKKIFFTGILDK